MAPLLATAGASLALIPALSEHLPSFDTFSLTTPLEGGEGFLFLL